MKKILLIISIFLVCQFAKSQVDTSTIATYCNGGFKVLDTTISGSTYKVYLIAVSPDFENYSGYLVFYVVKNDTLQTDAIKHSVLLTRSQFLTLYKNSVFETSNIAFLKSKAITVVTE